MATILELAAYADVSAENVLRVVHGEPVSEEVEARVHEAIDALGGPSYPSRVEVLPALPEGPEREELLEHFRATAAELETTLPQGVGSVVYEALRVEVRPVAQHVAELGALFERMLARLEDVSAGVQDERRDRLDDVALLTELVTNGWRSVDRRLARLEQIVARIEAGPQRPPRGRGSTASTTPPAARRPSSRGSEPGPGPHLIPGAGFLRATLPGMHVARSDPGLRRERAARSQGSGPSAGEPG